MKKALVLSGGGSKGAYQVGVLKRLLQIEQNEYDIICGTSVGALNAACIASRSIHDPKSSYDLLSRAWNSIHEKSDVYKRWFPLGVPSLWKESLYDTSPLKKLIKCFVDVEAIKKRQLRVIATSMKSGRCVHITENSDFLLDWILASCSIPLAFQPVKICNEYYIDGGLTQNVPLSTAIKNGATHIDVVLTSNPDIVNKWNYSKLPYVKTAQRSLDIMLNEMMKDDIRQTGFLNSLSTINKKYKNVNVRLYKPSFDVSEYETLDFSRSKINELIELGELDSYTPIVLRD